MAFVFSTSKSLFSCFAVGGGVLLSLSLAACSSSGEAPAIAVGDDHIACAVAGSADLKPVCSVERMELDGALTLIVRHPDGAFRRFEVITDGSGLAAADGAQAETTRLVEGKLEVTVGADRYLFPATEKANAPQ